MSPPAAVSGRRAALSGLLVATVVLYPLLDRVIIPPQHSTLHAVTDAMIYILLALGLNIFIGYAGLLDLCYASFFAIGAATMALRKPPLRVVVKSHLSDPHCGTVHVPVTYI